jgi:hypothetical protein
MAAAGEKFPTTRILLFFVFFAGFLSDLCGSSFF